MSKKALNAELAVVEIFKKGSSVLEVSWASWHIFICHNSLKVVIQKVIAYLADVSGIIKVNKNIER